MSVGKLFQSQIAGFGVIARLIMICSSKRNFKMEGVVVADGICGVSEVIWDC